MQLSKLNVTSLPEYNFQPSLSTFPLKSVHKMNEFELRALVRCTVYSNKTNIEISNIH